MVAIATGQQLHSLELTVRCEIENMKSNEIDAINKNNCQDLPYSVN
jgi:hypothetical protein